MSEYFQVFSSSIKMFEVFHIQPEHNILHYIVSNTVIDKLE